MYGIHLPTSLRAPAADVDRIAKTLSTAATRPSGRPALLRDYRHEANTIVTTCKQASTG
jgi:hypothetical protein